MDEIVDMAGTKYIWVSDNSLPNCNNRPMAQMCISIFKNQIFGSYTFSMSYQGADAKIHAYYHLEKLYLSSTFKLYGTLTAS